MNTTKKTIRRILSFVMAICLLTGCFTLSFAEKAGNITVEISVTYHQTEARTILDKINTLRTGEDAWYWNSSDTAKIYKNDLSELVYDYDLEKAAMKRAAEIAVYFSHTRTDGSEWYTAYSYSAAGENIAAGHNTADQVNEGWVEANQKYAGQGHRRNMLSSDFTAVGIACAEYAGRKFWVEEFRSPAVSTVPTVANDSSTPVSVSVSSSFIKSTTLTPSVESISMNVGESVSVPSVERKVQMSEYPGYTFRSTEDCSWSSSNPSVVSVSSGIISAVGAGKATLTGSCEAGSVTVSVEVSDTSDPEVYTLTYNANGGSDAPSSQTGNGTVTLSNDIPLRNDYSFIGWSTSPDTLGEQYQPGATFNLKKDTVLYAVWKKDGTSVAFTVTYKGNGGSGAPSAQTSADGVITLSTVKPVRAGYAFVGWSTDPYATEAEFMPGAKCTIAGNVILYAVWSDNPTANTVINVRSGVTVDYRSRVKVTATADNLPEGYQLVICDGKTILVRGDNKSVTYNVGEMVSGRIFTVYVVETNGTSVMSNSDGLLEKQCEIKVKGGFFAVLIAFFKGLFGTLPEVEIKP